MKKIGTFLAILVLTGVFFTPGIYGFAAIIILLMYGLISFPYQHLLEQSKIPGKWRVNWREFRQQLFLNGLFVFVFSVLITAAQTVNVGKITIIAGFFLITIIYSLLMGIYKEEINS